MRMCFTCKMPSCDPKMQNTSTLDNVQTRGIKILGLAQNMGEECKVDNRHMSTQDE